MDAELNGTAVAKRLASCNKSTRDRTLRLLKPWLSSSSTSTTISDEDLLKIWKGLFYCVWHADKLPVQVELINRLASLLVSLELPLSVRYFEAFLATIRREWSGIDHLRLDKFYLLIRRFVNKFFMCLKNTRWEEDVVEKLVAVLSDKTILLVDKYPAQGVNYHIAQVFLDEIGEFLPVKLKVLEVLLRPFFSALETSADKVLVSKIKTNVFERLLENGMKYLELEKKGGGEEAGSEVHNLGKIGLVLGISKKLFSSAASPGTLQSNRKVLFNLHERFMKIEKDLENSGIKVSLALENGNLEGDDGAEMVPPALSCKEQAEGDVSIVYEPSNEKSSKKKKKSKKVPSVKENVDLAGGAGPEIKKSNSIGKISKSKKKEKCSDSAVVDGVCASRASGGSIDSSKELQPDEPEDGNLILFNETVMSNLQKQFEKIAAEAGMVTPVATTVSKKRKKSKSNDGKISKGPTNITGGNEVERSGEKSVKRVRFSMKNNLVWKPNSPLPPQSLRLPPSATPRGSALKKGIPPGPVRETTPTLKKIGVKVTSVKRYRKTANGVSPSVNRIKSQSHSK